MCIRDRPTPATLQELNDRVNHTQLMTILGIAMEAGE